MIPKTQHAWYSEPIKTRAAGCFFRWIPDNVSNLSVDCVFGEGVRSFGDVGDGVVLVTCLSVTVCSRNACDVDQTLQEELEPAVFQSTPRPSLWHPELPLPPACLAVANCMPRDCRTPLACPPVLPRFAQYIPARRSPAPHSSTNRLRFPSAPHRAPGRPTQAVQETQAEE